MPAHDPIEPVETLPASRTVLFQKRQWLSVLGSVFLVAIVLLAYLPALQGGFVWDDDSWTTKLLRVLQDTSGLRAIWLEPKTLQQYYPLSGTTFWLDYQLWEFRPLPYHVENVLLHALAALLFWRSLRALRVPGAELASAIFALHPLMVESAAWITERKNVLSLCLCLASFLAFLRSRYGAERRGSGEGEAPGAPERRRMSQSAPFYLLALLLFVAAMSAKTSVCTMPAATLLLIWFRSGALRWREDVLPTAPVLRRRAWNGRGDGLARADPRRRSRHRLCFDFLATRVDCRTGFLVLSRQAAVAGQPVFHLSPLATRRRSVLAMVVSRRSAGTFRHALAKAEAGRPWTDNGAALLCRNVGSFARVRECLFHALLVRVRSLGLPAEPGAHRAGVRGASQALGEAGPNAGCKICARAERCCSHSSF